MATWSDELPGLAQPHQRAAAGLRWMVTAAGIWTGLDRLSWREMEPPTGHPSGDAMVRRIWEAMGDEIRGAAIMHDVPVELIIATLATETNPLLTLPSATTRRVEVGYTSDTDTPQFVRLGCMQTYLFDAQIVLRRPLTSADLFDPAVSLHAGAGLIASRLAETHFDPPAVAAAYSAGGVFPEPIKYNRWGMRCHPLLSGNYIDRFVRWFNDAIRPNDAIALAGDAPSFRAALHPRMVA